MIINDATYCTDEGLSNLLKVYETKKKGDPNVLSGEE